MINFIKKHSKLLEVILIFFLSLTPLLWLKDSQVILGHDSGFRFDPLAHLANLFYSWDPSSSFGTDWSLLKGFLVTQAPETFFILITKSFVVGQRLTFIFWFFSIGFSMYAFANSFFKERNYWFLRIFVSTFYMYNFFLLQGWFIAERAKFSLFAAIPLGTLIIYKTLTKEWSILKGTILFLLVAFLLNAGGNPTFYGTLILIYGITFTYLTAINIRSGGYKEIIYSFKLGISLVSAFLAVNAYWILPQVYLSFNGYGSNLLSIGGITGIIDWEFMITRNASFINLLRLQGVPDWYDNNLHTYASFFVKNPFLIVISFVFPLILFFGILYHKKLSLDKKINKLVILLLLLLLVGFFFTAGSHPPFGTIYIFLIKHLPGFAIFRSAFYKFGAILWFSYILIIGFYLNLFLLKIVKRKKMYIFLTILSFCFLLVYHSPFFNGNFFIWNKPFTTRVTVPHYVNDMADYINKLPIDTRILLLPEFDSQADGYQWGFWSIDSLPRLITNKSIIANSANSSEIINSIYYSVSQNEQDAFLRLTGVAGITKLLWRNDVLYLNKTTTSKDFSQVKKNLEKFNGVTLEKEFGAWSLYEIKSPYYASIIHSVNSITYAQSGLQKLMTIFSEEEDLKNSAINFKESMKDKDKKILLFSKKNIVGASCIACGPEIFSPINGGLLMPEIKILPTSPFYYVFSLREEQVKKMHKDNPSLRIDADLGYSNKRIAEMKGISNAKIKTNNEIFFIKQAIEKYKVLIKDALGQASLLSPDERNGAFMKISIYLNSQYWFLSVQKDLYDYTFEDFESLSIFMQEIINNLGNKIWATNFVENKIRYFLDIDMPGIYDLHITNRDIQAQKVAIDGKNLTEFNNLVFDKGTHKIEVSYPVARNLVDVSQATESGELHIRFGQRIKLPIESFDPKERYFVSFDYKISQGRPNASIIEMVKNEPRVWNLLLNQNSIWNSFSSVLEPNRDTKSVNLEFYPTGFETTGAIIQVKNLKVISIYVPEIFVSKNVTSAVVTKSPKISFSRLDPTMYKVNIENATSPFVLAFGESYNKGWRAYVAENFFQTLFAKTISETRHYTLNGYSNGWLVDRKGNYSIIVEYFPQKIFYAGLIISGISLLIAALILAKIKVRL